MAIWGPGWASGVSSSMVKVFIARLDSLNLDGPIGPILSPKFIPPLGPKLGVDKICGDEIECFSPLLCSMFGTDGDASGSKDREFVLAAPVFRLRRLGLRLPLRVGGFMNDGDEGSEVWKESRFEFKFSARLLGFFDLRGEGDVIGRSPLIAILEGFVSTIFKLWNESKPNDEPENEDNGTSVTGDSGEELGDGSDKDDESIVDIVVVGEESVESEVCVEVLSW